MVNAVSALNGSNTICVRFVHLIITAVKSAINQIAVMYTGAAERRIQ